MLLVATMLDSTASGVCSPVGGLDKELQNAVIEDTYLDWGE